MSFSIFNFVQSRAESLLENLTLRLYRDNGDNTFNQATDTLEQTIQSNNLGFYQFANLLPGNYFVWVDKAEFANGGDLFGCFSSTGNNVANSDIDNQDDGVDSTTPDTTGVVSPMVTLVFQNEPTNDGDGNNGNQTIDFGFYTPIALGNLVWKDLNNDGNYQSGQSGQVDEPLLENVKVNLFKDANGNQTFEAGTDTPVDSKLTNAAGEYGFTGLLPGDYFVQLDKSNFAPTGVLYGCVSSAGNSTADNNTDNNDDGVDNNAPATNGIVSTFITLLGGTEPSPDGRSNMTVDFGVTPTFSLGNRVWKDLDNSGTLNGTEPSVNGVTLRLLKAPAMTPATDVFGNPVPNQTTAAGGYYSFDSLAGGDYVVEVVAANFIGTGALAGCISSDPVAVDPDNDADNDDNGIGTMPSATDGVRSLAITLGPLGNSEPNNEIDRSPTDPAEPNANTNLTLDFGFLPAFSLGNRIWKDLDNSGTINAADGATPGIDGVTVRLMKSDRSPAKDVAGANVADQLTAGGGYYRFDNLPAGDYLVEIIAANFTGVLKDCQSSSLGEEADPNNNGDSNDNGTIIRSDTAVDSAVVTLGPLPNSEPNNEADRSPSDPAEPNANTNLTVDFGFTPKMTLGNLIWKDYDNDGIKDADESGVDGVTVELLKDADGNGSISGAELTAVATQTTAGGGLYKFENLQPGKYVVRVAASNFSGTGALVGCLSSTVTTANADGNANDDDNGVDDSAPATNGILTGVVTLLGNDEPTTDGDGINGNLTLDLGFYAPVNLGNLIWKDYDNDGLKDADEPGVDGVVVELLKDADNNGSLAGAELTAVATQNTTGGGLYNFTNLLPGAYAVRVAVSNFGATGALKGCNSSTTTVANADGNVNNDDNGIDNNAAATNGITSGIVTLKGNDEPDTAVDSDGKNGNLTVDFGFYPPLALGNLIWKDFDNDGVKDATEPGVDGVTIELLRDANNNAAIDGAETTPIASQPTSAGGLYKFTELLPGAYVVRVAASNFSATGVLPGVLKDCVSSTTSDATPDNNEDGDDNGIDNNAPATNGISTGVINLKGNDEPDTAADGDDKNGNLTVDLGFYAPLNLGNLVWKDQDNSGLKDTGEPGIDGVTVELLKDADNSGAINGAETTAMATMTTSGGGLYNFQNLLPGGYAVRLAASNFGATGILKDCRSSVPTVADPNSDTDNDDNGVDSASFATTGISSGVVQLSGDTEPANDGDNKNSNLTVDFGVYPLMNLGNLIFKDYNNDGLKDAGEPGIDGVVVELLKDTNTSTPIATLTTAGGGLYNFANLSPGTYFVRVAASNFNATTGVLKDCASSTTSDPADNNENNDDNGIDTPLPATNGITSGAVLLKGATEPDTAVDGDGTNGNTTIDFGFYPFMNLGNVIWKDYDNDGIKDADEPGVDGVTVELLRDADNNGTLAGAELTAVATLTIAGANGLNGTFNFQNLTPGSYAVRAAASNFVGTGKLVGCLSSTISDPADNNEDNDDNGADNAAPAANGITSGVINLLGNAEVTTDGDGPNGNLTVDLGFYPPMNLGNLVWKDLDDDGIKDSDEPGIDGITVELLRDADGNGAINGTETTPISSQVTAGGGKYNFPNLLPGGYVVRVAATNFAANGMLAGCTTSNTSAADPNNDIDNDDNGINNATPATSGISSGLVTLKGESEPDTAIDSDAKNGNLTVDFGFFFPMSVGNLVWKDYDNDGLKGANEPTINSVAMELLRDTNNNGALDAAELTAVATQTTAAGGLYKFTNLTPGNYFVRVAASNFGAAGILKDCVSSGVSDPTPNNNEDNDDNGIDNPTPATNGITTGVITLKGNAEPDTAVDGDDKQSNSTVDFGFFAPLTVGNLVWKDADNDGKAEAGEPGIDGVFVELLKDANANGTLDGSELTPIKTTTTSGGGLYKFEQLTPAGYFIRLAASNFATGVLKDCLSSILSSATPNNDLDNDDNGIDNATLTTSGITSGLVTLLGNSEPDTAVDGDNKHGNLTVDFGFIVNNMVIGNAVWKDKDGNGTRGATEPGIAGVKLTLFRDNGDGAFNAATDISVTTATSDAQGGYQFTQLYPATYFVRVDSANFSGSGGLVDCVSTKGNALPNGDVDNDDNGSDNLNPSVTPPTSGAITLVQGTEPATDGDGANGNLTIDFGFFTPLTLAVQDPATCTGPGSILQVMAMVTNTSDAAQPNNATDEFVATLPAELVGLAANATATISGAPVGTVVVTANKVVWNGAIPANSTLTIKYNVQVSSGVANGIEFCILNTAYFDADLNGTNESQMVVNYCDRLDCAPLGPGLSIPNGNSVLIFPTYTSNASNPAAGNTRINLTNTNPKLNATLHLFFIDGDSCSVADSYLCLTPNQTAAFLMSDLDPGTNGFLMVVAVDGTTGCPTNFNYLIGDEYVKYDSGHTANLSALGATALASSEDLCNGETSTAATLKFDGVNYSPLPRALALSNLPSRADGNDTLLILDRIGGNLARGLDAVSDFAGLIYDDAEKAYSFAGRGGSCQFRNRLDGVFPRTTPRFDVVISAGRSGWLKLWSASDGALVGAALNRNTNAASQANAFNGGHSLHTLTTTNAATLTMPVFPPSC